MGTSYNVFSIVWRNFYSDKLGDQGYDTPFLLAFGSVQAFLDTGLKPGHAAALAAYMQRVKLDK